VLKNILCAFLAFSVAPQFAVADTVTNFEESHGGAVRKCSVELFNGDTRLAVIGLNDWTDMWMLNFTVNNQAEVYKRYFDKGKHDSDKFEEAFSVVRIGDDLFNFSEVLPMIFGNVDEASTARFHIKGNYSVSSALRAMNSDIFIIEGLLSVEGAADAFVAFRKCSYRAMDLVYDEITDRDYRFEYRQIFESSFETWIINQARAEACLVSHMSNNKVAETIKSAAQAFYPGLFNYFKRREYSEELNETIALLSSKGSIDAITKGCFMVGQLANMSFTAVEVVIDRANNLD